MADRVVSYSFRGNFTNLMAGLSASGAAVGDFGTKLTALDKNGAKMRAGLTSVGTTAGKIGLVAAAGLAAVVGVTARFEKAMSAVQAATHETAANMDLLRDAAVQAGADTAYSASEAAGAIEELAKAGISTKDILGGGLAGALDLAAAGALDVGRAAEIAATAMTQFKLEGSDVSHVADLLAAGAGKAQGSVDDLGMALKQSGLVAAQTGLSIEETTGTLAAFASAGLIGSDAGTSFKTMLQSLTPSGDKARDAMEKLGISAYDAQGNFIGMTEFAGNLRAGLADLSVEQQNAALKTIFGSDAVRAAAVIYDQGAEGIQSWIDKTNDAGFAAETAATRLDNLAGDWEQFTGSLETALIGAGSGSQGALRDMVQGATAAVNAFNDLPPAVQGTTTKLLGLTAVTGGGLWFGSKVVSGIVDTKTALSQLGVTGARVGMMLKTGLALGGITAGLIALNEIVLKSNQNISDADLGRNLEALARGADVANFKDIGDDIYKTASALASVNEKGNEVLSLFGLLGNTPLEDAEANVDKIDQALAAMVESGNAEQAAATLQLIIDKAVESGTSADEARAQFDSYAIALENVGGSSVPQILDDVTGGLLSQALGFTKAAHAARGFIGAARETGAISKEQAKALRASREAAHEAAGGFVNLGNGLDNAKVSLNGWIKQLEKQADALRNFRENAEQAAKKGLREGLIAALQDAGTAGALRMKQLANATDEQITRANRAWKRGQAEVNRYTDAIGGVPPAVNTNVNLKGIPTAMRQLRSVQSALNAIHDKTIHVDIVRGADSGLAYVSGGQGAPRATPKTTNPRTSGRTIAPAKTIGMTSLAPPTAARTTLAPSDTYARTNPETAAANAAADALHAVADKAKRAAIGFEWVSGGMVAELKVRQRLLEHEVDRDKQRLDMLKQERQALADSIKARFSDSPFGQQPVPGEMPSTIDRRVRNAETGQWETQSIPFDELPIAEQLAWFQQGQDADRAQQQSPTEILQQQLADAREMKALLKKLQQMGLSGPALAQVATTASIEEMYALIASGRGGISQYEQLLGALGNVSAQMGGQVAGAVYDPETKVVSKALHEHTALLKSMDKRIADLTESKTMNKLENAVEEGTRKGQKDKGPGGHPNRRAGARR